MKFNYLLTLPIFALAFLCISKSQVKAAGEVTENTHIDNHHQTNNYNYAAAFPYTTLPSNINSEQENQRQVQLDFGNYDKFDKTEIPTPTNNYDNNEPVKRKPIIKYTEEQLNLPNPYLINSNVPKDDKEIPCSDFYYPCKTNFKKNEDQSNNNGHRLETESSISKETAPNLNAQSSTQNMNNFYGTQSQFIPQNSNPERKIDERNGVIVVCYGLECSAQTQIKEPSNNQVYFQQKPIDEFSIQRYSDNSMNDFIKNFEQSILKAIINDLQYMRTVSSKFSETDKTDGGVQGRMIIESDSTLPLPCHSTSSNTKGSSPGNNE